MNINILNIICDELLSRKNNVYQKARYSYIKKVIASKEKLLELSIEEIYAIFRDLELNREDFKNYYLELIKS